MQPAFWEQPAFWDDNAITRGLAKHSMGRKVLNSIGARFLKRRLDGFDLLLDLQDRWGVSKYILKYGEYDRDMCTVVKRIIPPNPVCVDIGANIGFWTNFLVSDCQAQKVFSIEPEPNNGQLFKSNVQMNDAGSKVQFFPMAVGDRAGQLDLYLSDDNAGDHQLYQSDQGRKHIKVDVNRVDDLIGSEVVDFVKMDVQGFESYVVNGMLGLLERSQDIVVLTEYWPSGIKKAGSDPQAMLNQFGNRGFKFYFLDEKARRLVELKADEIASHIQPDHHIDLILSRRDLIAAY